MLVDVTLYDLIKVDYLCYCAATELDSNVDPHAVPLFVSCNIELSIALKPGFYLYSTCYNEA